METQAQKRYPIVASRNFVALPGLTFPLRIGREESVAGLKAAREGDGVFVAVLQKDESAAIDPRALHLVGTLCKIEQVRGAAADGYQVVARGIGRFEIASVEKRDAALVATGFERPDEVGAADKETLAALLSGMKDLSKEILRLVPADTREMTVLVDGVEDAAFLTWLVAGNLDLENKHRQALLEIDSVKDRALKLLELMKAFRDELQVRTEIRDKLTTKLGKNQREAILREQLRAIQEELGESEPAGRGKDDYRKKIEDANMPEHARKAAEEELKRLESLGGSNSPETHVIRNYLDLLTSLPWSKSSESDVDLERAREILDEEHYGLEPIKKRILQHLAVMKLKQGTRGSILLFVGPPGVGKTSLGQSIAKALGRKFVRGSLGGVRDDAEIRGHRRTYVGAMPGRIIQGIKRAQENNPVFMLDEIDKMGRSFHGDPGGALLEVLDPEQNATFLDHYLDVTFDLSKVFFVATANGLDGIPAPLLDRMEVIELSGYTTAEKLHIAKRHLLPREMEENGLAKGQLEIADDAMLRVITHYTREAGVRDLRRKIAAIARANVEKALSLKEGETIRVGIEQLEEALGPERFVHEVAERVAPPGVVTGLAWTPMGGDILFIESSLMEGTGKLTLTGQLGDVMKESAQIALSLVRSRLPGLVAKMDYGKKDLHIHVPAGAIPKDGPSAGVAMLTTIASLFSGRSASPKLAMTGEVTLRGAVMPVGGIKEKVLGAHRAGIERILLSSKNKRDLKDVPEDVRAQIKFEFVDTASDVLRAALGLEPEAEGLAEANSVPPQPAGPAAVA